MKMKNDVLSARSMRLQTKSRNGRRTEAIKAYLVSKGIDGYRIHAVGKGEHDPVADNATAEGRAMIEVMPTPKYTRENPPPMPCAAHGFVDNHKTPGIEVDRLLS